MEEIEILHKNNQHTRIRLLRIVDANNNLTCCIKKMTTSGVARICCAEGQRLKLCHGALTVDFGAGCSSC